MSLDKAAVLAIKDRQVESVDLPRWGGEVYVRSLSAREMLALEAQTRDQTDSAQVAAAELVAYICDKDGAPLFSAGEGLALLDRRPADIRKILSAARKLNAYDEDEREAIRGN